MMQLPNVITAGCAVTIIVLNLGMAVSLDTEEMQSWRLEMGMSWMKKRESLITCGFGGR
jgi:hypothetical protein